ncbi:hypothetical protein [Bradyrhizobium sp. NBAIM14]|uniref:hypothetical protein n=1 Tax=Bradyrhizobium sp. NBAIM14 TaxID=2793814 RepID=UPI001CD7B8AD|nr:hypothetical protein [Bradyrhizobium sp. NBAIM14]MCA1498099.1 hypothetical protein [Bradyrhizobium sp. NBAIM14]
MTDLSDTPPPGWLFKVENHKGDPFARYIAARLADVDEATAAVREAVEEKIVTLVQNLSKSEVEGMQPGEVRPYNT